MNRRISAFFTSAFVMAAMLGTMVPTAQAEDGFGMAGCGLGSLLFGDDPGFVQVFAATTNGTFGSQTFGITSGTSNCEPSKGGNASAKLFVETNREAVAKDIARGQGETLASLATLAGCSDVPTMGRTLQSEFNRIFPNESVSDAQVGDAVVETLQSHEELSCDSLS